MLDAGVAHEWIRRNAFDPDARILGRARVAMTETLPPWFAIQGMRSRQDQDASAPQRSSGLGKRLPLLADVLKNLGHQDCVEFCVAEIEVSHFTGHEAAAISHAGLLGSTRSQFDARRRNVEACDRAPSLCKSNRVVAAGASDIEKAPLLGCH